MRAYHNKRIFQHFFTQLKFVNLNYASFRIKCSYTILLNQEIVGSNRVGAKVVLLIQPSEDNL